ncbi:hypothetical protein [Hydrogenobacter thermophilus]
MVRWGPFVMSSQEEIIKGGLSHEARSTKGKTAGLCGKAKGP